MSSMKPLLDALSQCPHLTSIGFAGPSAFTAEMCRLSSAPNAAQLISLSLEALDHTGESVPWLEPDPTYYPEAFKAMSSLRLLTLRDCIDAGDLLQFVHHSPSLDHIVIEPRYERNELEGSLAKIDWLLRLLPDIMCRLMQLRVTIKMAAVGSSPWQVSSAYSCAVHKRLQECWLMDEFPSRFRLEQA